MKTKKFITLIVSLLMVASTAWAASPKMKMTTDIPQVDHRSGQSKNFDRYPEIF